MKIKAFFNWSTGKDSALGLYHLIHDPSYEVDRLVTTLNSLTNRVSMHGVRKELLLKQVESLEFPISIIELPGVVSMDSYDSYMKAATLELKQLGYTHAVFGDIFLEDLKHYRISKLNEVGLQAHFPLWKQDTSKLMEQFINLGFKAVTVAVNAKILGASMVGRTIDAEFLKELPTGVDPCGENGEFHSFVYDGPIFKKPIDFSVGEKVLKSYSPSKTDKNDCFKEDVHWDNSFWFCDLIP